MCVSCVWVCVCERERERKRELRVGGALRWGTRGSRQWEGGQAGKKVDPMCNAPHCTTEPAPHSPATHNQPCCVHSLGGRGAAGQARQVCKEVV